MSLGSVLCQSFPRAFWVQGPEVLMESGQCQTQKSCHVKGQGLSRRQGGCTQARSLLRLSAHDKRNTDESRTLWEWQGAWTVRWTGPTMFRPEPKRNEDEVSQS
ncbi:hypothetical protein LEMLEM_LOCUS9199, partial [Lemmus lemmus]